jgi:glutathione peroxidase
MKTNYLLLIAILVFISGIIFLFKDDIFYKKDIEVKSNINFYDIKIDSLSNGPLDLKKFKNRVILVVNVASKCGFTGQYKDLETLYKKYKSKGFIILGVPSNDFAGQEPGTAKEIQSFCQLNYGVSFPMTQKVIINKAQQHELYNFLRESNPKYRGTIKWNFTKFLIDKNGMVVDRFSPITNPMSQKIIKSIEKLL